MRKGIFAILGSILAIAACNKHRDNPIQITPKPSIQSFLITNSCTGMVSISGDSFDLNIGQDSVYFGPAKGMIISVTATQLIAEMPPVTIAGPVTVFCDGKQSISTDSIYQYIPVITSFTPVLAGTGTRITISGHGFNPNPQYDSVYFNNIPAEVYSADTNQLMVIVPSGNTTGPVTLRSNCQNAAANGIFTLSNKGAVYIGSNGPYFYSIDIASGVIRWTFPITSSSASPLIYHGVVYIGAEPSGNYPGGFYALDANTGKQLWENSANPWGGYPTLNQDTLFAGSYDDNFYALNTQNGQNIWSFHAANGGDLVTTSGLYNGSIYTGSGSGYLYCLNSATGNLIWSLPIWPIGSPAIVNGTVYIAGYDSAGENNYLYALDGGSGQVIWKSNIYEIGGTPLVSGGILYIGNGEGNLFALNASSGQQIWKSDAGLWTTFAQLVGGMLFYTTSAGAIQAVDITTGNIIWNLLLAPNPFSQPGAVVANGAIYVGDGSGTVHAINAATGTTIWSLQTTGAPILSSPCVVDSSGVVYSGG